MCIMYSLQSLKTQTGTTKYEIISLYFIQAVNINHNSLIFTNSPPVDRVMA